MAWAVAKVGYGNAPVMDAIADEARRKVHEISPSSLSNIAWAYATLAYLVRPFMASISTKVVRTIQQQDIRDIANLAFAFATLRVLDEHLRTALSAEAINKLHLVLPQSLAFLTEVGLDASAHPTLVRKLEQIVDRVFNVLPKSSDQWRRGPDLSVIQELHIDHLGSVGTKMLLHRAGIAAPASSFVERAVASFPRSAEGHISRFGLRQNALDSSPQQRRIFAYAEFELSAAGIDRRGRILREHGFQGLRRWQKGWLRALTLPVNLHVDRSVCAEFQVMNEICDFVSQEGLADDKESCPEVAGHVDLLVCTTPCLSCVCAAMQFQLLFSGLRFRFGCVQPWHSGGSDGALKEPKPPGSPAREVLPPSSGPETVKDAGPLAAETEAPAGSATPLHRTEIEALAAAVRNASGNRRSVDNLDLASARTWEDVRRVVQRSSHECLAELLRSHRQRVQVESRADRVERVFALDRKSVV